MPNQKCLMGPASSSIPATNPGAAKPRDPTPRQARELMLRTYFPGKEFNPPVISSKVTVFAVDHQSFYRVRDKLMGWGDRTQGGVDAERVAGDHMTILREPHVSVLAENPAAAVARSLAPFDGGAHLPARRCAPVPRWKAPMTQSPPLSAQEFLPLEADDVHIWPLSLDLPEAELHRLEGVIQPRKPRSPSDSPSCPIAAATWPPTGCCAWIGPLPGHDSCRRHIPPKRRRKASAGASRAPTFQSVPLWSPRALGCERQTGGRRRRRGIREIDNIEDLAKTCFSPAEQAALAAVPAEQRKRAFFAGWTRKEAFLKALGDGLSRPLDSFTVSLAPAEPAKLLRVEGAPSTSESYAIRSPRTGAWLPRGLGGRWTCGEGSLAVGVRPRGAASTNTSPAVLSRPRRCAKVPPAHVTGKQGRAQQLVERVRLDCRHRVTADHHRHRSPGYGSGEAGRVQLCHLDIHRSCESRGRRNMGGGAQVHGRLRRAEPSRRLSGYPPRLSGLQAIVSLLLVGAGLVWVFLALAPDERGFATLAMVSILPSGLTVMATAVNTAVEDLRPNVIASIAAGLMQAAGTCATVVMGWGLVGLAGAQLAGKTCDCVVRWILTSRRLPGYLQAMGPSTGSSRDSSRLPPGLAAEMTKFCGESTILAMLAMVVWSRSEMIFLKRFCDIRQVAFYSVAFGLSLIPGQIVGPFRGRRG